jgi:YVTN family beta-propeller protein
VNVIDTTINAIAGLPIPVDVVPRGIAITSDGSRAYVSNLSVSQGFGNGTVSIISTTSRATLATLTVGGEPTGIAVTPDGRTAYVANADDDTVSVIDASTLTIASTISVGVQPEGLVVSPDGLLLYVATYKNVYVVSTSTNAVLKTIAISDYANGIAISHDGQRLYVANINSNVVSGRGNISVVSTATGTVTASIPVGVYPNGVAVSPDGARVYVANSSDGTISVIDTAANAVISTVQVGAFPIGVSVTPDNRRVYVANSSDGTVSVIDTTTNGVAATISGLSGAAAFGNFIGPDLTAEESPVVEFYNLTLDHYFMTQATAEIADLDAGVHPGWARTGQTFLAWSPGRSNGSGNPVCRYYGLPSAGLDSHFYSASPTECAAVAERFSNAWSKEADDVFEIGLPNTTTGTCPAGTTAVFRLWNGRTDSNHRYTTDAASRQQMIDRGWIPEGYGVSGVVMCAPN